MQIEVILSSKTLYRKLSAIVKVISSRSTMPTHSYFLFKVENNELIVVATDIQTTVKTVIDTDKLTGEGEVLIEHSILLSGLKELPEQPIKITIDELQKIKISYERGSFNITGLTSEDFSMMQNHDKEDPINIEMKGDMLVNGIKTTLPYAANDELRPVMYSVFMECKSGQLNFTATNAHYMAVLENKNVNYQDFAVIIDPKAARLLSDLISGDEPVNLYLGSKTLAATFGEYEVITRLIDGVYPNYRAVIPQDNSEELTINKNGLIASLKRVGIFSNQASSLVILNTEKNKLIITGADQDYGSSAKETLPCCGDTNVQIGFKSEFLQQCLKSIGTEEARLSLKDSSCAGLITPVDAEEGVELTILLMPMLVNV